MTYFLLGFCLFAFIIGYVLVARRAEALAEELHYAKGTLDAQSALIEQLRGDGQPDLFENAGVPDNGPTYFRVGRIAGNDEKAVVFENCHFENGKGDTFTIVPRRPHILDPGAKYFDYPEPTEHF